MKLMMKECLSPHFPKVSKTDSCMIYSFYAVMSWIFRIPFFLFNQNASEKSDVFRNANSSVLYFILGLHFEEDKKTLESILPEKPSTGLKRQHSEDDAEDARELSAPGKIPKKGQWAVCSSCYITQSDGPWVSDPSYTGKLRGKWLFSEV